MMQSKDFLEFTEKLKRLDNVIKELEQYQDCFNVFEELQLFYYKIKYLNFFRILENDNSTKINNKTIKYDSYNYDITTEFVFMKRKRENGIIFRFDTRYLLFTISITYHNPYSYECEFSEVLNIPEFKTLLTLLKNSLTSSKQKIL